MAVKRVGLAGLLPVYFEVLTLEDSTAIALSSTAQANAHVLYISVETNSARMRADGTDPTLNTGVVFEKDVLHVFEGYDGTSDMKFQRTASTSVVSIQSYKHD